MTVAELKKLIADLPDDMPVAVSGYEGGITVEYAEARVVNTHTVPDHDGFEGELEEEGRYIFRQDYPAGPRVLLLSRHKAPEA